MEKFEYNESLDFNKLPQEYKGIKFYPLLISEDKILDEVMGTIGIPKSYIKTEPIIMKMSYLKFLCFVLKKRDDIIKILSYITKNENIRLEVSLRKGADETNIRYEDMNISVYIDEVCFNESDFDIIREIILRQNYYSTAYIEEYDPELEELLMIKQNTLGKSNSLTDKKFVLCSLLNKLPEEISNLSYYQFYKLYYSTTMVVTTKIYQGWISSGFISLEKGKTFNTYLDPAPDREGRYDSIKMSKEDFFDKVGMKPS
jgi:hypothetical protein